MPPRPKPALKASDDNLLTMQATIDRTKADLEKARLDFKRAEELYQEQADPASRISISGKPPTIARRRR